MRRLPSLVFTLALALPAGLPPAASARAGDDPLALDRGPLVFVAPFQARSGPAASLAAMLPTFLVSELDAAPDLRALGIDGLGFVGDTPAPIYAASCPPDQFVGCAYVMAEAAGADYALAGSVTTTEAGASVELHVVDVREAEERVAFTAALATGGDAAFAEGVRRVLVAVAEQDLGRARDIRASAEPAGGDAGEKAAQARELDRLVAEIGDASTLSRREGRAVERPRFTVEQLVKEGRTDAAKPWERLDMTPGEYLRYRNSGLSLVEWRRRARGRRAQLLARPFLGVGRAPVDGRYYGRMVRDADDFSVVESWTWQAVQDGTGVAVGGQLAWGLRPDLEVGVYAGVARGRYSVQVHASTEGLPSNATEPEEFGNTNVFAGPQVLWVPWPTASLRPVLGLRAGWWRGTAVDDHVLPPDELPRFDAPTLWTAGLVLGGEARVAERMDLYLHLPVQAVVAGEASAESHEGAGAIDDMTLPPAFSGLGAGVRVGFQLRFFGPRARRPAYDDLDDPAD